MFIAELRHLLQGLANAIVEVNIAKLAIYSVKQDRKSTDLVVFNDDGEGLTNVAAASLYALSISCKAPCWITKAINGVICVEELAHTRSIVTLRVKQDEDVLGLPVGLKFGHQLNKGECVDYGWLVVEGCSKDKALTTIAVLRTQIRVDVMGTTKAYRQQRLSIDFASRIP